MPSFFEMFASRKGRLAEGRGIKRVGPEAIIKTFNRALLFIQAEVAKRTPRGATGITRGSYASEVRGLGASITGIVGTPLLHGLPLETGTRPHFPPPDALMPWVIRKLGVSPADAEGVAFAVARAISRRGTKGARMFARTLKEEGHKIDSILDEIVPEMIEELEA